MVVFAELCYYDNCNVQDLISMILSLVHHIIILVVVVIKLYYRPNKFD